VIFFLKKLYCQPPILHCSGLERQSEHTHPELLPNTLTGRKCTIIEIFNGRYLYITDVISKEKSNQKHILLGQRNYPLLTAADHQVKPFVHHHAAGPNNVVFQDANNVVFNDANNVVFNDAEGDHVSFPQQHSVFSPTLHPKVTAANFGIY
jgi:hypothetical protein